MVLAALARIEEKLDRKAEQDDHQRLEERVRKNENDITRVYTLGGLATALSGLIGWKF